MGAVTFGGGQNLPGPKAAAPNDLLPNQFETITLLFTDEDNVTPLTPLNPEIRIEREGMVVENIETSNTPVAGKPGFFIPTVVATGELSFTFSLHTLEAGLHDVISEGTIGGKQTRCVGQFNISFVSRTAYLIQHLRRRLFDIDPNLYQIEETGTLFPNNLIHSYLQDAMSRINSTPPGTVFTLEQQPGDIQDLLVTGGWIYALKSRAVLEIFNTMQYSDGISLAIDRGPKLQALALSQESMWREDVKRYKNWHTLFGRHRGGAVGMGTVTIPIQISRVLSLLPNLSQTFGL